MKIAIVTLTKGANYGCGDAVVDQYFALHQYWCLCSNIGELEMPFAVQYRHYVFGI